MRRSGWKTQSDDSGGLIRAGQIVLLDTIGELASVYSGRRWRLSEAAWRRLEDTILWSRQFGVAIVMGPHYANFRAITEDLLAHDAIRIAPKQALAQTLVGLLNDSEQARAMGERARSVFEQQAGATMRCVAAIRQILEPASGARAEGKATRPGDHA